MRQTISTDANVTQLQAAINDQFGAISAIPFMNGVLLTGVSLVTGSTNTINHKLGRLAQGYFVVSKSTGAIVWNDTFTDAAIPLHTSANCTVSLWVF